MMCFNGYIIWQFIFSLIKFFIYFFFHGLRESKSTKKIQTKPMFYLKSQYHVYISYNCAY